MKFLDSVFINGIKRPLGHIPSHDDRNVSDANPLNSIPESDWVEFDLRDSLCPVKVKDQDGKGACNGFAAATTLEWCRWFSGQTHKDLSSWFIYSILCGGFDRGSNIGDALKLLSETGTCLDTEVKYGTINPRLITSDNRLSALNNKVEIGSKLRNFDDLMTSTQLRYPFNFSIRASSDFNNLDRNGCVPITRGIGNHAISGGLGAKKLPDGEWAILFQNSWGTQWGDKGFAWFRRGSIDNQQYFEAYEVSAPTDYSDDRNNPPPLA